MIEAAVTGTIAVIAGATAVVNRMTDRMAKLDQRIDNMEIRLATDYVTQREHIRALESQEARLIRIEQKIDIFIANYAHHRIGSDSQG